MQQIAYISEHYYNIDNFSGACIPPDPPKGFLRFRFSELQLPTGSLQHNVGSLRIFAENTQARCGMNSLSPNPVKVR